MKIIDQRYLDCDNRYSTQPCLLTILEVDEEISLTDAALEQRLQAALPGLRDQRGLVGVRCAEVPRAVELVQQTAIELHRLALNEVTVGFIGVVPRMRGRYRLVLPYTSANAAAAALALAAQLVSALGQGRWFNLKAGLARLRALSERRLQPRNGALMRTARKFLAVSASTFSTIAHHAKLKKQHI